MPEVTLQAIEGMLAQKLDGTEKRIIKRIDEAQEELARIIAETVAVPFTRSFDELENRLDYSERIRMIENRLARLEDNKPSGKFRLNRGEA